MINIQLDSTTAEIQYNGALIKTFTAYIHGLTQECFRLSHNELLRTMVLHVPLGPKQLS